MLFKTAGILVLALCWSGVAGCSQKETATEAEAAIIALLYEESNLAIAGDIDGLLALYVQDEKNTRLSVTKNVSAMITGWEAVRRHQENLLASDWMSWQDKRVRKENVWVKVDGDHAWAVCDNVWQWREDERHLQFQNIQITICEKDAGNWKIAFQAFIRDPENLEIIETPSRP